ncbi:MAG: archaellin/type IV pilin N-terminal domain-containing protein [Candidatus Nanohaloarchaea archaeon]
MEESNSRKGISPLIASVLLIAFTLSVAMIANPFFSNTLKDIQSGTSERADTVTRAANLGLEIMSVEFNRSSNELEVVVQNTGEAIDENTNISIGVIGGSVANTGQHNVDLGPNEITTLSVPVDRTYPLDTVQAAMTRYPVSTEKSIKCMPTDNLIGFYPLNGDYREVVDNFDGKESGDPVWKDKIWKGDGAGDYYTNSSFPGEGFDSKTEWTVAAVVKLKGDYPSRWDGLINLDATLWFNNPPNKRLTARVWEPVSGDHLDPRMYVGGEKLNKWTLVGFSFDHGDYKFFADKQIKVGDLWSYDTVNNQSEPKLRVGDANKGSMKGSIRWIGVWNKSISNRTIKNLAALSDRDIESQTCKLKN